MALVVSVFAQESTNDGSSDGSEGMNENVDAESTEEGSSGEASGAAGSNPLSSTTKLDLAWEYKGIGGSYNQDFNAKGSFMLHPKLKLNYEAHYQVTDVTGSSENDWESARLKPIWFPKDFQLNEAWGLRTALGAEWIIDFNNKDKGIGAGGDQIAPLGGLAFISKKTKTVLIPLSQHFVSYEGDNVNQTAFRFIALQPLPHGMWAKLDAKLVRDWANVRTPADGELELGKMFSPRFGFLTKGFLGVGKDRGFDWGVGIGPRFMF